MKSFRLFLVAAFSLGWLFVVPAEARAAEGLTAELHNVLGQNGSPYIPQGDTATVTTTVPNINFQWGGGSVLGGPSEDVIVRFTGSIRSNTTQDISFLAAADDGTKLYLDGALITSDWVDKGGGGTTSAPVSFTAGVPKTIELMYYENGGGAWVQLLWDQSGSMQVIPAEAFTSQVYTPVVPKTIGAPRNLVVTDNETSTVLAWEAPDTGNTNPERYAISFSADGGGWGIATGNVGDANALNTTITINHSLLESLKPSGTVWSFHIRSDNDTLALYSANSNVVTLKIGKTAEEITAEALIAAQVAAQAEAARIEAARIEAETAALIAQQAAAAQAEADRIAAEVAAQEAARLQAEAAALLAAQQEAARIAAGIEAARIAAEAEAARIAAEVEAARIAAEAAAQAEADRIAAEEAAKEEARLQAEAEAKAEAERIEAEIEAARIQAEKEAQEEADRIAAEIKAAEEKAEAEAKAEAERIAAEEEAARVEAERVEAEEAAAEAKAEAEEARLEAERLAEEKAEAEALKKAAEEGKLTAEQKTVVATALIESVAPGEALSASAIKEAGLEYKDLPAETPVDVRTDENGNAVVITAEVAAQVELLENPGELLATALSDPGAALAALGSIGADMSDEEREEATDMVVATVVAAGAAMNAVGAATGSTGGSTSGGSSGGGSSGGGGPSGDSKGVRRRKS